MTRNGSTQKQTITRSPSVRTIIAAALWLVWLHGAACACEGHSFVRVALDPLPSALAGIRVEVHKTIAQQVVIENRSGKTVEVLDDRGVPFIRVGPAGAEGNRGVPSWYLAQSPGAIVPASMGRGRLDDWRQASEQPVFGWFDSRLDTARVRLAPELMTQGEPAAVGHWQIPLRVDGQPVNLTGQFRYEPPAGTYESRLTSAGQVAPGVQVTLLPGRSPGLMLRNASARAVVVYGESGEPFLRIGPGGVEANLHSPTWWRSARSTRQRPLGLDSTAPPRWTKVGGTPRFSWIEPRAAQSPADSPTDKGEQLWAVPLRIGDQTAQITGVGRWRSFSPAH